LLRKAVRRNAWLLEQINLIKENISQTQIISRNEIYVLDCFMSMREPS